MPILILPFPIAAVRGAFAFHSHYRSGLVAPTLHVLGR